MCNIVIINVILGVRYLLEACKVLGFLGFGLFFFFAVPKGKEKHTLHYKSQHVISSGSI